MIDGHEFFGLSLFGSCVYDPESANDVDFIVHINPASYVRLVTVLKVFFDVDCPPGRVEYVDDGDGDMVPVVIEDEAFAVKTIRVNVGPIGVKIDFVDAKFARNLFDFVECSIARTGERMWLRYSGDLGLSIEDVWGNLRKKMLTPIYGPIDEM